MASRILHCLTLVAVLYPLAGGADFKHQPPGRLEKFYVVDVGEYDTYPYWGADIVDVQAAAGGAQVRYTSIDGATGECDDDEAIQGAVAVANVPVADLAFGLDFCTLDPEEFNQTVAAHTRKPREYESLRSAVVAQCGEEQRVFQLPEFQMDKASLKSVAPSALRMTRLSERILNRAFRNQSWESRRTDLPPDGSELRDLRTGHFDRGFWFVAEGGEPPGLPARVTFSNLDPRFGADSDVGKLHNVLARYKHPRGS